LNITYKNIYFILQRHKNSSSQSWWSCLQLYCHCRSSFTWCSKIGPDIKNTTTSIKLQYKSIFELRRQE